MNNQPWYHTGLRFSCTACGHCCSGEPGNVWVTEAEIAGLAAAIGISTAEFEKHYTRRRGVRRSLREFPNGDCVLLDAETRKCTAYEARPVQCRTWPFWDSNLRTPAAWAETCAVCPGAGEGELHTLEIIERQRNAVRM